MIDIFQTLFRFKEKESPDELGYYPERVHVDAFPERRYLWTSRLLVILAGLSICFNMMLASAIYLLLPMIEVSPQFYKINKYFDRMELIQKREIKFPVSDLVTEQYVRDYVVLRYTITDDYQEMLDRWSTDSTFYWCSAPMVYSDFESNEKESSLIMFRQKGIQRYVDVEWVIPLSRGLWQVQFKTVEFSRGKREPVINYWRATMRIAYANISFPNKEDRSYNPYGFLVVSYSLAYHGTEGDTESYLKTMQRLMQGS